MCECLVGICHLVGILTLLDGGTEIVACIHDLACKTLLHGLLATLAGVADEPTKAECLTAGRSYFDRNLVGSTADTASLDFQAGHMLFIASVKASRGSLPVFSLMMSKAS